MNQTDFVTKSVAFTYFSKGWAWAEQVVMPDRRRVDIMLFDKSTGERHAVEVKVSTADLLAEVKNPGKRVSAVAASNRFFFAVPSRLADLAAEVISHADGLIVVDPYGAVSVAVDPGFSPAAHGDFVAAAMATRALAVKLSTPPRR